jgi:hypothetical protein
VEDDDDDEQAAASAETSTTPARPVPICLTRVPNPFFLRFMGSSLTLVGLGGGVWLVLRTVEEWASRRAG